MAKHIDFSNQFDALKVSTINDPAHGDFGVFLMVFDDSGESAAVMLGKQAALQLADRLNSAAERVAKGAEQETTDF